MSYGKLGPLEVLEKPLTLYKVVRADPNEPLKRRDPVSHRRTMPTVFMSGFNPYNRGYVKAGGKGDVVTYIVGDTVYSPFNFTLGFFTYHNKTIARRRYHGNGRDYILTCIAPAGSTIRRDISHPDQVYAEELLIVKAERRNR